jgi:probable rRNA maturation factor
MAKRAVRRPEGPVRLHVTVTDARGRAAATHGLPRWLASVAPARARGHIGIALVSDATMRRFNREFRGKDYATDVLSFTEPRASASEDHARKPSSPQVLPVSLGDLAIATGVAARQARAHGHALRTELRILALHGLLHLLGYDHEVDAGEMHRVEDRIRRRVGLPVGLIARTPGRPKR